jgi:ribosomal protein S12 methylthiotransferase
MQKSPDNSKKVHFVSLGCPKNLVDTEIMLGSLSQEGYSVTQEPEEADTIVVNTCGFIEDSKAESIRTLLESAELKKGGKVKTVVAAGCLTQRYKDDLVEGLPEVDLFVGSGEFQNISDILAKKDAGSTEKKFFNLPTYLQKEETPRQVSGPRHSAYLKISEGCKKRCAFCAIPVIRGNLQSREVDAVVAEAKLLVAGGAKELIVISHDFTDYGWDLKRKDPESSAEPTYLLERLAKESGATWIRVLYRYPDGISDEMIDLMVGHPNLIPYFDMPLQHSEDSVLKRMNRKMTRAEIERVVGNIRAKLPHAVFRTQFIVGFPGETNEEYDALLDFIEKMSFDRVGCFKYSPEEKTPGFKMPDQIDEEVKQSRHDSLMEIQKEISRQKHESFVGKTLEVLVEGLSEETELLLQGRSWMQAPEIDGVVYINDGHAEVGEIVKVKITESHDYDLVGHIVN